MKNADVIDVWMQHPTMRFLNNDMFESLRRWTGGKHLEEELPARITLDVMNQANVSKGLISAWYGPQGDLISNEDVKALVDEYPDRFIGVAGVNLRKPVEAVQELHKCVEQWHFKALRIVQWLWELPPTHRYYYPLYTACVELGVPVCLQVGHTGPLCPSETGRPIPYIDQIALDFPELNIVCGHIGYPWTTEMIAVATKHTNVYIDTSAYTVKRFPAELVDYMRGHGRKKVLFGTNYPMLTAEKCLENIDSLNLDEEVKSLFLSDNARRVFNL